ncbi:uncharacterized protein [Clytia hemisphaerica]|uniref:uncharacterized protein n=1 Tax=Clytia hemisphaerica TaxID=252671 RepID=UPI0034D5FF13
MPRIINGADRLHAIMYPIQSRFKSGAPIITLEVKASEEGETSKIIPKPEELKDYASLATELEKLSASKLSSGASGRPVKLKRGKSIIWPWNVICGVCEKTCMVRFDGTTAGRVDYFKKKHYDECLKKKNMKEKSEKKSGKKKQLNVNDMLQSPPPKKRLKRFPAKEIDSDVEVSSGDEQTECLEKPDSDLEVTDWEDYEKQDYEEPLSDQNVFSSDSDSGTICDSEAEIIEPSDFDENWRYLCIADVEADPVCKRLDKLIRDGWISKDQIFYKYLNDVTQIYYDTKHPYDKDVIEFFSSIAHLGGESTFNFVRGPMRFGNKERGDQLDEIRMNLGGPGVETIRKNKTAYTTAPGVLKYLSLLMYRLLENNNDPPSTIVSNTVVDVYPVVFSNDGTALKPSIQFDEARNVNVGLEMHEFDYDQCKTEQFLKKEMVAKNIVCEAVVSSVTSLDNDVCLPLAVHYSSKSGKSGDNIKQTFTEQIRMVQICQNCNKRTESVDMILPKEEYMVCDSYCKVCYDSKTLCQSCSDKGQTEIHPALRACDYCLKNGLRCTKRCVFIITVDCESGNKQCLKQLQQQIEDGTIDPYLSLLSILPDVPHLLKTCKASFANWYLQLNDERGCLSIFYTLRNRAEADVQNVVRLHLKSQDYVRNRDRQNPSGVLALCNPALLAYIKTLGFVAHTIVPETIRHTTLNQKKMYQNIDSVTVGSHGYLLFLCSESSSSTIYKAKLHNPIQDIQKLAVNVKGDRIRYNDGLVYCYGKSSVFIYPSEKKSNAKLSISAIKTKKAAVEKLKFIGLPSDGTTSQLITRLHKHQSDTIKKYKQMKVEESTLLIFMDHELCRYQVDTILFIDTNSLYIAFGSEKLLAIGSLKYNSVGVETNCEAFQKYDDDWQSISDMAIVKKHLIIAHKNGLSLFHLESRAISNVPHCDGLTADHLAPFRDGFLFIEGAKRKNCIYLWRESGLEVFAGKQGQDGSRDGTASYCRFFEVSSITVEFNNVVYASDRKLGSIKVITELNETANFLRGLKKMIDAFSVHEKHQAYSLKSLDEAISLVSQCDEMLSKNTEVIRSMGNLPRTLNGPEGNVSAITIDSIKMLHWGLKRLKTNTESLTYDRVNLLSCMTLAVENLHSAVNKKQGTQTLVSYAQSFASSVKESIKSATEWSAHYFTSRERWYPLPNTVLSLSDLDFPKRAKRNQGLTREQKREMREWASINGAVVRQRSGRQETTMARAGTLPENAYYEELRPNNNEHNSTTKSSEIGNTDEIVQIRNTNETVDTDDSDKNDELMGQDEVLEFESDIDGEDSSDSEDETVLASVSRQTTFLVGTSSRYGRSVTLNRKYLQ